LENTAGPSSTRSSGSPVSLLSYSIAGWKTYWQPGR
jgi:hypothetical protein